MSQDTCELLTSITMIRFYHRDIPVTYCDKRDKLT